MVERYVRDVEAAGSNPVTPIDRGLIKRMAFVCIGKDAYWAKEVWRLTRPAGRGFEFGQGDRGDVELNGSGLAVGLADDAPGVSFDADF